MKVKLSKWAKMEGIHYNTAYRWFYLGYIKGAYKSPSGSIFVVIEDKKEEESKKQS